MKSVYSILTFSVNITYPKSYFENNINYLPFKYFDIILLDKKKNGKVVYLFPLVEEIMVIFIIISLIEMEQFIKYLLILI